MGTLRNKTDLESRFPDNETQSITPSDFRDIVESVMGVGTVENEESEPGTGNGLERLGNRRFRVLEGGDGQYLFVAQGHANIDQESRVRVAIAVNDVTTSPNYIRDTRFYVDGDNHVILTDVHDVVENDEISLEFYVTSGNLSDIVYSFVGVRVG